MPAKHQIDDKNKLIFTMWAGEAIDSDVIESLKKYQQTIKNQPKYFSYNEIVDFSKADSMQLSVEGIKKLGEIAVVVDHDDVKTKLAIIVNSNLAFGLARMYQVYRSFSPNANKELRVFKNEDKAFEWISCDTQE